MRQRSLKSGACVSAALAVVLVLALFGAAQGVRAEEFAKGTVVPRVECQSEKGHTFALYLPQAYTPERAWPVVFCFSPDAQGDVPVRLLAPAAERYGYILAGSNNSKNGSLDVIRKAQAVLWKEVNARFPVDPKRSYGAGFSGGARAALYLALSHPDRFAGVISCGAFWAEGKDIPKQCPLALFMVVGSRDYGFFEFTAADKELSKMGVLHWLLEFDGVHQWPPEPCLTQGIEFMQAAAMKRGFIPEDGAFLEGLLKTRLDSAAALSAKNLKVEAFRQYRQDAELYKGLPEAAKAQEAAEALRQDPEVRDWLAAEPTFEGYRERLESVHDSHGLQIFIKELQAKSKEGGRVGAAAELTMDLVVRSLDMMGVAYLNQRNFREAQFCYGTILSCRPKDGRAAYNMACVYSRMGFKKEAVASLKRAAQNGFKDLALIEKDPDLDYIRSEPGYLQVVNVLRANQPKPAP
jgi:predicted esterase